MEREASTKKEWRLPIWSVHGILSVNGILQFSTLQFPPSKLNNFFQLDISHTSPVLFETLSSIAYDEHPGIKLMVLMAHSVHTMFIPIAHTGIAAFYA